jgi:hypothetical protein
MRTSQIDTPSKNFKTFFENIVLDNITLEDYGIDATTDFDKVQAVYNIFLSEYGHEIKRYGENRAFSEWLQGLPSVLTVPFYYWEQTELAMAAGIIDGKNETKTELLHERWWNNCAQAFFTLKDNL